MTGSPPLGRLSGVILVLALSALPLRAQCAMDLLDEGVRAFQELHLQEAAQLLREALDLDERREPCPERARALIFLGAAELFRDNRAAARDAFRRLVVFDPTYEPDELVFPPEVSELFHEVRRETRAVRVQIPEDVRIRVGEDDLVLRLVASTPHPVRIEMRRGGGERVRRVYAGHFEGTVTVAWDGRDGAGAALEGGLYDLRVASLGGEGAVERTVVIPIEVRRLDGAARPEEVQVAEPAPGRERNGWGAVGSLATGVVAGAAAFALPRVVGSPSGEGGSRVYGDGRLALGVAVTAAGIAGFVDHLRGSSAPVPVPTLRPIEPATPVLHVLAGEPRVEEGADGSGREP